MSRTIAALAGLVLLAAPATALAQHGAAAPKPGAAQSMQGDQSAWIKDPHWRQYYDLTVQAFANGPSKVDEKAYTKQAYAIFADFGASHGMKPDAMVDHLKLIPGQVVQIVREDPHVLDSLDNFIAATFGPQ